MSMLLLNLAIFDGLQLTKWSREGGMARIQEERERGRGGGEE